MEYVEVIIIIMLLLLLLLLLWLKAVRQAGIKALTAALYVLTTGSFSSVSSSLII